MTTRRDFLKAGAAGVAVAAAGRTTTARAQSMTPVKIGAVVLGDFGVVTPTLVGIEKGYFKQNGLEAELIPFKGGRPSGPWPRSSRRTTSRSRSCPR